MINPFNRRVWAVTRREYLQRVRSKWFLFSTLAVPVLFVGAGFLPALFVDAAGGAVRIGVVDRSGKGLETALLEALEREEVGAQAADLEPGLPELRVAEQLAAEGLDAFLLVPPSVLDSAAVRVLAAGGLPGSAERQVERAVRQAILVGRLTEQGVTEVDAGRLLEDPTVEVQDVTALREGPSEMYEVLGFVFAMVLYLMFLIYGQMITRGVQEEKGSDIVEVLVSSVRPQEMMLGKIVGVGAVGLTQVGIWALILAAVGLYGWSSIAAGLAEAGLDLTGFTFPVGLALLALLFFLLGYLLYAALFAAAGAMLSSEQDVQQVMMPIIMLIVIPVMIMPGLTETPDAGWAVVVSLIPFFSPILMIVRVSATTVPFWEVALAIAILVATILGVAWIAGRIYRIGILMKGKRPNLPELMRWVRYG